MKVDVVHVGLAALAAAGFWWAVAPETEGLVVTTKPNTLYLSPTFSYIFIGAILLCAMFMLSGGFSKRGGSYGGGGMSGFGGGGYGGGGGYSPY